MKIIYKNTLIILIILVVKISVLYIFQNKILSIVDYLCESIGVVPKGKQEIDIAISIGVKVFKISLVFFDFLMNFLIWIALRFLFVNFKSRDFIYNFLIISFFLLILVLLIIK